MTRTRLVVGIVALFSLVLLPSAPAAAATIIPTTFADDATTNGNCTLREAIIAANTDAVRDACPAGSGADTVQLQAGTYVLSVGPAGDDAGENGDLDVLTDDLTLTGVSAAATTIDANGLDRVVHLAPSGPAISVAIRALTVRGGSSMGDGGGILSETPASVTVSDAAVSDNLAVDEGGAMQTRGTVVLERTVLRGNEATSDSGAIENFPSPTAVLTIRDSLIVDNQAPGSGAIENYSSLTISNSTFSGNRATTGSAGAIRGLSGSTTTITSATIAANTAVGSGGGILAGDTLTIANTILADNAGASGANCGGSGITSNGGNVADDSTCPLTGPSDIQSDPGLQALGDNGGPTATHAIPSGSSAIDRGSGCLATDQRGAPRSGGCDSGAYELVLCQGVVVNRIGSAGDDALTGTDAADGFLAGDGNDTATGLGGDDTFCLGNGNDTASAGAGSDTILGEAGNDTSDGGDGDDLVQGGDGDDTGTGGGGNDQISGEAGDDTGTGGGGNDQISGEEGNDTGDGGEGNDTFAGGDGNDVGTGGAGKDLLKGENGNDQLKGGTGKDRLLGGREKDKLNCGGGTKELGKGGGGKDRSRKCEKGKA